jgi:RimJ/RimL family protein N-acetyltransferase
MRDNYFKTIIGEKVRLVPYRKKFVEKYHEWMKSPFLLEMTASEPLSIEEEYDMQKSWREDSRKCTFIVLQNDESSTDEIGQMAGDVNLFLNRDDDGGLTYAEIDVMIAEERFRKQGMGEETVLLMMWYGMVHLNIKRFFAKINKVNESSIKLFKR